ncbi:MAG: DUF2155 domain-containing protein [Pseudomonadota bacterium]
MRKYFLLGVSALFVTGAFAAQEQGAAVNEGEATETELDRLNAVSELEALSRNADDPFAGVIEKTQREPVSVTLRALDKITARYTDVEISMHEIARFGSLELQPRYCDKRPPEEFPETTVFLEVFDTGYGSESDNLKIDPALLEISERDSDAIPAQTAETLELEEIPAFGAAPEETADEPVEAAPVETLPATAQPAPEVLEGAQAEGENIFRGWMFASAPALNALEHPVYDVWVIDCKTRVADSRAEAE